MYTYHTCKPFSMFMRENFFQKVNNFRIYSRKVRDLDIKKEGDFLSLCKYPFTAGKIFKH